MTESKIIKIAISQSAASSLDNMRSLAISKTQLSQLSRQDLASWLLVKFEDYISKHLQEIEQAFFDPMLYFRAIVEKKKQAESQGNECPEFVSLASELAKHAMKTQRSTHQTSNTETKASSK